jgi:uncharacterized membrane protein YphA (DoxX/SURF4 family)
MTDSSTAARQAFLMLRIAFTVAPILFGLDKFANVLTDDWTKYLSSEFNSLLPGDADTAMSIVGVIEIVAGTVVAIAPRYGSVLVAGWLGGIIANLLLVGGYGDVALRDFGLMLGALTLARLAWSEVGSTSRAQSRVFQSGTGGSVPAAGT